METHRPGRNPKLLDLTDDGAAVLEERGHEVPETGRRGITHRYWQDQVRQFYESDGFDVEIEHGVGQQHIDVYAERSGESVAVEVACSPEHEVANVEKCLEYGADTVEVVCVDDRIREQVEANVREVFDEAVKSMVETMLAVTGESLRNGGIELSGPVDFMGWTARYRLEVRPPSAFDDELVAEG